MQGRLPLGTVHRPPRLKTEIAFLSPPCSSSTSICPRDQADLDVLGWMRAQPQLKQLPVVMLSRSADPDLINRAYQLGANSYLIKPTSFTALVELVSGLERYLGTSTQRT